MAETEQNKTEEPTSYKLKRAREKGQVARGTDLGFFAVLAGLTLYAIVAGADLVSMLARSAERILRTSIDAASAGEALPSILSTSVSSILWSTTVFACTIALTVLVFETIQIRGIAFSAHPLKPDFGRLNPGKNLKRLFSLKMVKETIKNVLKLAVYSTAASMIVFNVFLSSASAIVDAGTLTFAIQDGLMRLLFTFTFLALVFAAIDQVMARREFQKQMRMSRSELTREVKEREGEPRIKRKRKELHALFAKQTAAMGNLPGSDMIIVNPEHYAVALSYDSRAMEAPSVRAKGRNALALMLKKRAADLSIPIFEAPPLARALYKRCNPGDEIPGSEYRAVVDLYLKLASARRDRLEASNA